MNRSDKTNVTRVLVVDDNPSVSDVVNRALLKDGHEVECCGNAVDAMDRLANRYFPVVITDLRLPDGMGTEILHRSLRLYPQSAVIVITGDSRLGAAGEAVEQGAFGYIPKPFDPANVQLMVRRAVERAELLEERDQYKKLAMTDPLTRLGNRRKLDVTLEAELARSQRFAHPLSLLVVDIDDLKRCNDAHGHPAGDAAIRAVAGALVGCIRQIDTVTRSGGDEFAVILPETPPEGAAIVAERQCREVAGLQGTPMPLSVSIGRASCPADVSAPGALFADADGRMYEAKRAGGNGYWPR